MGQLIAKNIALYDDMAIAGKKDKGIFEKGEHFDIVIDFSLPEGAKEAFQIAKQNGSAFLCGTTNLTPSFIEILKQEKQIEEKSETADKHDNLADNEQKNVEDKDQYYKKT